MELLKLKYRGSMQRAALLAPFIFLVADWLYTINNTSIHYMIFFPSHHNFHVFEQLK